MVQTLSLQVVENPIEQHLPEQPPPDATQANGQLVSELVSYLTKLGLEGAHVAKVISLLNSSQGEIAELRTEPGGTPQDISQQDPPQPTRLDQVSQFGGESLYAPPPRQPVAGEDKKTISLYVAEEQEILKVAYQSFFSDHLGIEVLASSGDTSAQSLVDAASRFAPDVMLIGVKAIRRDTVEKLEILRDACPKIALVLLFAFYDEQGISALREFSRDASAGGPICSSTPSTT